MVPSASKSVPICRCGYLLLPLAACLATLSPRPATARTWHVPGDTPTVIAACQAADSADTVLIAPGDYDEFDGEHWSNWIFKPITVRGSGPRPEDTNLRVSFAFRTPGASTIENVRIHDEYSPVLYEGGALSIRNCVFESNTGPSGGACGGALEYSGTFPGADGSVLIEDSLFKGNQTLGSFDCGGAIGQIGGDGMTIRRCRFIENRTNESSGGGGGAIWTDVGLEVEDSVFWKNTAPEAAAIFIFQALSVDIHGCTFYGNIATGTRGSAVEISGVPHPGFSRCVFAETRGGVGLGCDDPVNVVCCDFWNNDVGGYSDWCLAFEAYGDFVADPLFCGPELGDFRLMEGSPCLPGNHGGRDCGLIGAFDQGCVSPVREVRWGTIKRMFR